MTNIYDLTPLNNHIYMVGKDIKGKKGWNYCYFDSKKLQFLKENLPQYDIPAHDNFYSQIVASTDKSLGLSLLPDIKENLKSITDRCFEEMKALNPSGGLKEFVRMA